MYNACLMYVLKFTKLYAYPPIVYCFRFPWWRGKTVHIGQPGEVLIIQDLFYIYFRCYDLILQMTWFYFIIIPLLCFNISNSCNFLKECLRSFNSFWQNLF